MKLSKEQMYCPTHLRNKRDNTWYAKRRESLRVQIQEGFDENSQIFGARKMTAVLRNRGVKVAPLQARLSAVIAESSSAPRYGTPTVNTAV